MLPGQFGGANWGASAADPATGMLYVRTGHHPTIHQLTEFDPARGHAATRAAATLGRDAYGQAVFLLPRRSAASRHPDDGSDGRGFRSPRSAATAYARAIRQGQGQMPAFGEDLLSDNELRSRPAFLGAAPPAEQPGGPPAGPRPEPEPRVDPGAPKPLSARDEGLALYKGTRYTGPLGPSRSAPITGYPPSRRPGLKSSPTISIAVRSRGVRPLVRAPPLPRAASPIPATAGGRGGTVRRSRREG